LGDIIADSLRSSISELNVKIDSLYSILKSLIDDGSSDEKNAMIMSSLPGQAGEVYLDLINTSPFLSDTVLKSTIIKDEVLNNDMITDIMSANPQSAKNNDILDLLDNRIIPLNDSMWYEIMKGNDTIAEKESLEGILSSWIAEKQHNINNLIRVFDLILPSFL
jgi:hypothetical protein